ncbi:phage holin family protein [Anaerocolumna sp. AGMB13020]|uniref:phage holin family protein n=1 Tax=Anaerocolumna sp. AGMB13020 TaxID=3081750 RepID=UPI0029536F12|nr:phage holin family protein [Anaerocolumna sp. AGMB13020]WOO34962.1 phage holin family protein [Anaerocolumna sp. AGMB13020]
MEKLFNTISMIFGVIGGFICKWLGGSDLLLKTIIVLVILDYTTGVIKGIYEKNLSSEIGFKGILKKIMIFIVIATAWTIQKLLGEAIALREIVIMFFVVNEALSLLENAAVLIPIPDKLKETLLQIRDKEDTENDK